MTGCAPFPEIADRLLEMRELDEKVRARLAATGALFDGYHDEMRAVHDANAALLDRMIDDIGWPDEEKVGAEAAEAAWLIAQHAIAQPAFMRRCSALLEAAIDAKRAPPWQLAYLEDRIRTFEGRPQRFGTQYDWDEQGRFGPLRIDDEKGLDARRTLVGLPPHGRSNIGETTDSAPSDPAQRRRDFLSWRVQVGWAPILHES